MGAGATYFPPEVFKSSFLRSVIFKNCLPFEPCNQHTYITGTKPPFSINFFEYPSRLFWFFVVTHHYIGAMNQYFTPHLLDSLPSESIRTSIPSIMGPVVPIMTPSGSMVLIEMVGEVSVRPYPSRMGIPAAQNT